MLAEAGSRIQLMLDLGELGTWDIVPGARSLDWNGRAKSFFGLSPGRDVTYELFLAGVHADDRERVDRTIQSSLDPSVGRYEVEFRTIGLEDGVERVITARGEVFFDQEGKPRRLIGVSRDITVERKTESELRRMYADATAVSDAKSQFIANVSHEMRTPLGAIIGFAELGLEAGAPEAERLSYLRTVKRNGEQLLKIINEVLDLSKVDIQKVEFESMQVLLADFMTEIRETLAQTAIEKGIVLDFNSQGRVPKFIETDPMRLKQILVNLIGNAIKFTAQGQVAVEVGLAFPPVEGETMTLEFRVKDSGIGIRKEHVARLFKPFSQVDSSMTRRFGGTGLGLALSKRIAQAFGGELVLEWSEPGRGSTFRLRVPDGVCRADTPFVHFDMKEAGHDEKNFELAMKPSLIGLRVLLAEDAPDNQILVSRYLVKAGATVDIASNGQEAVEKAQSGDYDIVLMDLQMPVLSGYAATAALREHGFAKPIIALTAHAMREEREKCLKIGFTDHITKPVDRMKLLSEIAVAASASGAPRMH